MNQRTKNDFLFLSTQPRLKEQFTPKKEKSSYLLTNIDGTFLQLHSETTLQHSPLKKQNKKAPNSSTSLIHVSGGSERTNEILKDVFLKKEIFKLHLTASGNMSYT